MDERERLKIDTKPIRLRIESEPYVKFMGRKYSVVLDVFDVKKKREYFIVIEAQSLSQPIYELTVTEKNLRDIEIWLSKESEDKYAKYEIQLV